MRRWFLKKLLFGLLLLAVPGTAAGQVCAGLGNAQLVPYAYEALTVSSTAVGFTADTYTAGGATPAMAHVMIETASIRFRVDGGTPTSAVGQLVTLASNVQFYVCGESAIRKFLAIRTATTNVSLKIHYYRVGS